MFAAGSAQRLIAALITVSLALSPLAEARRLGGGGSAGKQRSITRNAAPPQQPVAPAQPIPQQQPQPAGNGMGKALAGAAVGAAVGAAGGYMLGKSMNASGAAQSESSSFPWGWLLLLGALTIGGIMLLRRRTQSAYGQPAPAGAAASAANWQSTPQPQSDRVFRIGEGAVSAPAAMTQSGRLPDGTETAAFLRQARASFLHMQALNSPEQLEELRKYLTPELFNELKGEIAVNRDLAEFPELQVELADTGNDNGQLYASARFYGRVSEALNAAPMPFEEIWHFVKPRADDPRWLLAGIQQSA